MTIIGLLAGLAVAIVIVQPQITAPAISEFASGQTGPVWPGSLFPFLFVTIACGALSGFHALIASGTTPKLIEKEKQTRFIGYGGMLMESFVAIMALVAAVSIDQGIYFAMNASAAATGGTVEGAVAFVNSLGLTGVHLTPEMLTTTAANVGEESIVAAMSFVKAGMVIPPRSMVMGTPASGSFSPDRRRRSIAAASAARLPAATIPEIDEIFRIAPPPLCRISGRQLRMP